MPQPVLPAHPDGGLRPRTRMSKQAAFSRVIWSAMVKPVKTGRRLANSTILIMHLVASSLNLSQRPRSSRTRWSALEFYEGEKTLSGVVAGSRAEGREPNTFPIKREDNSLFTGSLQKVGES